MTPSTAIQRPDLGLALEEFDLNMGRLGFVATNVAPVIDVGLASANFSRITLANLLQNQNTARAPGTGYGRSQGEFTQDNFTTSEQGFEGVVDDNLNKIYAYTIDSEMVVTKRTRDVVLRNYEKRMADLIFNTTTWTGAAYTTGVGTGWSTLATATPITDVRGAIKKIYDNFGILADTMVLPWKDYMNLRDCAQIVDKIKYSGRDDPKNVTAQMLAEIFDLRRVVIAGAVRNTAAEGQAATLSPVWSTGKAMICKTAETNDLREPCIARTFHFTADGSSIGGTVEEYRSEEVRGNVIRVRHQTGEKVINKECGHLLTGI